jgi:hypothetical protein
VRGYSSAQLFMVTSFSPTPLKSNPQSHLNSYSSASNHAQKCTLGLWGVTLQLKSNPTYDDRERGYSSQYLPGGHSQRLLKSNPHMVRDRGVTLHGTWQPESLLKSNPSRHISYTEAFNSQHCVCIPLSVDTQRLLFTVLYISNTAEE